MALHDYLVGEVVEDYSDRLLTRREALRRLCLLGMSLSSAAALLAACSRGGDRTTAPSTTGGDGGGSTATSAGEGEAAAPAELIRFRGSSGEVQAAFSASPAARANVLVIHENRGLTPHFHDLVGRLAREGYAALAVDLLSPEGGTAALADPGAAPGALSAAPLDRLLGGLRAGIDELLRRFPRGKVGAVGFCFGGGMTWNLLHAGEARLAAAAPFYGPAPDNADFRRAKAAVLGVYAERDTRVNASRDRAEAALKAAGLTYEIRTFAGADHAFFNDTGPRYNEGAATEAWRELLGWFGRHLV